MLDNVRSRVARFISKDAHAGPGLGTVQILEPGGRPARLSTADLLAGYSQLPWLRAVVAKIAEVAAAVEWFVTAPAPDGTRQRVEDHLAVQVLNASHNAEFTGLQFRHLSFVYSCLVGENFWLKERNLAGAVISLWPIPPHWITRKPYLGQGPYTISHRGWQQDIPPSEILYYGTTDPFDPYGRGTGAQALIDELVTDEKAAKYIGAFFENRARPDLLISSASNDRPIGEAARKRLETSWDQKVGGAFGKWFRPMFVEGGKIDVKELGRSFQENQVIDLRRFARDTVLQFYGLPPEALAILETSNRATITAAELFLTKHVVLPKLKGLQAVLNERLIVEYDPRLRYEFVNPVDDDAAAIAEMMKTHEWAFDADEIREQAKHDPLPDEQGQVHFVPFSGFFTDDITTDGIGATEDEPGDADEPVADDEPGSDKFDEAAAITGGSVLNGAQVSAIVDLVSQVSAGTLSAASAIEIMGIAFGITPEVGLRIIGDAASRTPQPAASEASTEATLLRAEFAGSVLSRINGEMGRGTVCLSDDALY